MDTRLMDLLVCPLCKGPLSHAHDTRELICAADRLAFPLRDGIAIMLESEARALDVPGSDDPVAPGAAALAAQATDGRQDAGGSAPPAP